MSHFNINLIADTANLTTLSTGSAYKVKTALSAFLTAVDTYKTHLADVGVNSDFEMSDEIIDQLNFCANAIEILTKRLTQINWQPIS